MDLKESHNMAPHDEYNHWWIQTRFLYLKDAYSKNFNTTEIGCGTGVNLKYLSQFAPELTFYGVDKNLNSSHKKENIHFTNDVEQINQTDFLILMDVLEHLEDDEEKLGQWLNKLNNGGKVFITVPAFQFLWSTHDEYLDHKRRYTKKDLIDLARKCGLEVEKINYAFSYLLPIAYILRKVTSHKQTGLKKHPKIVNLLMKLLGKTEHMLGGAPFGTSVVGVFRKC